MCGLIGMASAETDAKLSPTKRAVIRQLLYADALRGVDATGVALISRQLRKIKHATIIKKAWPSAAFLSNPEVNKRFVGFQQAQYVIGHNRAGTKGNKTDDSNAHPFHHGDIIMTHNGTLWTGYTRLAPGKGFSTDSEHIAYALSQTNDAKEVLEKLDGSFSLVWYDHRDKLLHMARNDQRPMCLAAVKGERTIYYASEMEMLKWVLSRNDVEVEQFWTTNAKMHITFDRKDPREFSGEKFREYTWRSSYHDNYYGGRKSGDYNDTSWWRKGEEYNDRTPKRGNGYQAPNARVETTHANSTTNSKLTELGYRLHQRIPVRFYDVQKSLANPRWGTLEGITEDTNSQMVLIHGVDLTKDYSWEQLYNVGVGSVYFSSEYNEWIIRGEGMLAVDDDWEPEPEEEEVQEDDAPFAKGGDTIQLPINLYQQKKSTVQEKPPARKNGKKGNESTPNRKAKEEYEDTTEHEDSLIRGPLGPIKISKFNAMVQDGCAGCPTNIFPFQAEFIGWTTDWRPLCPECKEAHPEMDVTNNVIYLPDGRMH